MCINAHVFLCHACLCWHVWLQADSSLDIIAIANQKWAALISRLSTPLQQHSGEWMWSKFPVHRCEDPTKTHTHTHTQILGSNGHVQYFHQTSTPHCFCLMGVRLFSRRCVCLYCESCIWMRKSFLDLTRMHDFVSWTVSSFKWPHLEGRDRCHVWTWIHPL